MRTALKTKRLRIVPLPVEQLYLLSTDISRLEKDMGLNPSGYTPDEHLQQAIESMYRLTLEHPDSYFWYTNWQIILISENKSIGSAGFKGGPDDNGGVEIGYGINEGYCGNGYITEAVNALCKWALEQQDVNCVIAETEKDNVASHRVLEKNGMIKYKEVTNSFWWKLKKNNNGK